MIILVEGPRNSGKTHLIKSLSRETFKFPFDLWFEQMGLTNGGKETHLFALSKEIMLHQLNRDGLFSGKSSIGEDGYFKKSPIIVDRGILTTWVWGILQDRVTKEEVLEEIDLWNSQDLFKDTQIIIVTGKAGTDDRKKDVWDGTDTEKEKELYNFVLEYLYKKLDGNKFNSPFKKVIQITNSFDDLSVKNFNDTVRLCVES